MKKYKLIELMKKTVKNDDCFNFNKIDGCRVICSKCLLRIKFDNCAGIYFNVKGGCDCIIFWNNKVALIECKLGKFGSSDAKKASEQIKKCHEFVQSKGYDGHIEAVIYFESIDYMSKSRVEKDLEIPVKFHKCGVELT